MLAAGGEMQHLLQPERVGQHGGGPEGKRMADRDMFSSALMLK